MNFSSPPKLRNLILNRMLHKRLFATAPTMSWRTKYHLNNCERKSDYYWIICPTTWNYISRVIECWVADLAYFFNTSSSTLTVLTEQDTITRLVTSEAVRFFRSHIAYAYSYTDDFKENPDMSDRWYCFVWLSEEIISMHLCPLRWICPWEICRTYRRYLWFHLSRLWSELHFLVACWMKVIIETD